MNAMPAGVDLQSSDGGLALDPLQEDISKIDETHEHSPQAGLQSLRVEDEGMVFCC